jgi:hypothetical protein
MTLDPQNSPAAFWKVARALADYSGRAYNEHTIKSPTTNAQVLICERVDENDVVFAFKGSKEPIDFLRDAEFWRSPFADSPYVLTAAEVHHGFQVEFRSIATDVVSEAMRTLANNPSATFVITGHSLGGDLAKFCAFKFAQLQFPLSAVITFGEARVGNKDFAQIYDSAPICSGVTASRPLSLRDISFRVVNQNDIIPRTPFWGYWHCGQEVFLLPESQGCLVNPSLTQKVLEDVVGLYGAYRRREHVLVREHFIDAYQRRIQLL